MKDSASESYHVFVELVTWQTSSFLMPSNLKSLGTSLDTIQLTASHGLSEILVTSRCHDVQETVHKSRKLFINLAYLVSEKTEV